MSSREVRCACGAINDVTFGTCIRCGKQLGAGAQDAAEEGATAQAGIRVAQPRVRISTGGASDAPRYGRAALLLGGLCTLVFVLQVMLSFKRDGSFPLTYNPGHRADAMRLGALLPSVFIVQLEPFRLLSAVFVHFGFIHFALNMYGFVSLARSAEGMVGSSRTIMTFLLTGVVGYLATVGTNLVTGAFPVQTAGASGGILGVMGLLIGVLLRRRDPRWKNLAINTLFLGVMFGFAVNASNAGFMVNNSAHIGGLIAGLVLGLAWSKTGAAETRPMRGVAGLLLVASVASVVLAVTSPLPDILEGNRPG